MANTTTETPATDQAAKTLKQFRSSQEIETIYRFIHENGLRKEAHHIMTYIVEKLTPPKKRGRRKSKKKLQ